MRQIKLGQQKKYSSTRNKGCENNKKQTDIHYAALTVRNELNSEIDHAINNNITGDQQKCSRRYGRNQRR